MNKNTIPIFLASDNNYAPFVATTICSIIKNTDSFIDFFILDGGITPFNKYKIELMKEELKKFSITYYNMADFALERFPNTKHYSVNAFSRYFIPELENKLNKILYLDVDIIVRGNIAELFNQDLENYPVGAILEDFYPHNYSYLKKICPTYKGNNGYFNSGVLLLNLDYFRKNKLSEKLINTTIELKDILSCPDQDVFNFIFDCNFKILDYKFNFMPDHFEMLKDTHPEIADNIKNNAIIIHYTAGKPWYNNSIASNYFWDIAKLTYFYDEIVNKLNYNNITNKLSTEICILQNKLEETNNNLNKEINILQNKLEINKYNINWIKIFGIYNNSNYLKIVVFGISILLKMNTEKVNKLAWFIPIKKWRDNFRKKFE